MKYAPYEEKKEILHMWIESNKMQDDEALSWLYNNVNTCIDCYE